MDIKEAFNIVINVLKTECAKHSNCPECVFYAECKDTDVYPHTSLIHLRDMYFNSTKQKDSIRENRELINNTYFNRVMAAPGDQVICVDNGGSYTTYDSFFKQIEREDLKDKYCHAPLQVGEVYTVMDIGPHREFDCNVYILHDSVKDKVFLCTDDTDYIKRITDKYKWTERSRIRINSCIQEVENEIDKIIPHRFLEGGYLQLEDGRRKLLIPAATKMSSNNIKKRAKNFMLEF